MGNGGASPASAVSQPSTTPFVMQLPDEILNYVFRFLIPDYECCLDPAYSGLSDFRSSLLSISVTCRRFHKISRPLLWHSIDIDQDFAWTKLACAESPRMLQVKRIWLQGYVSRLDLSMKTIPLELLAFVEYYNPEGVCNLVSLVSRAPELRVLVLTDTRIIMEQPPLQASFYRLRALHIDCYGGDLRGIVKCCMNLEWLAITADDYHDTVGDILSIAPLHSLRFIGYNSLEGTMQREVLKNISQSVRVSGA